MFNFKVRPLVFRHIFILAVMFAQFLNPLFSSRAEASTEIAYDFFGWTDSEDECNRIVTAANEVKANKTKYLASDYLPHNRECRGQYLINRPEHRSNRVSSPKVLRCKEIKLQSDCDNRRDCIGMFAHVDYDRREFVCLPRKFVE